VLVRVVWKLPGDLLQATRLEIDDLLVAWTDSSADGNGVCGPADRHGCVSGAG
jgi:hypothetical protein